MYVCKRAKFETCIINPFDFESRLRHQLSTTRVINLKDMQINQFNVNVVRSYTPYPTTSSEFYMKSLKSL